MATPVTFNSSYRKGGRVVRSEGVRSPIGTALPVGTIVYTTGFYEAVNGDIYRLGNDFAVSTGRTATDRAGLTALPDYTGG